MSRRIAVLVRRFPKLSETFILGEIAALADSGLDVRIISLRRPYDEPRQPEAANFADRVTYLNGWPRPAAIARFCRLLLRRPDVLRSLLREPVAILRSLISLVDTCRVAGIGHVHAHYIAETALIAELAGRLTGTSFSVSAHAKDIYQTDPESIAARISRASFVTTCTAYNHDYLVRLAGPDRNRILLSYHGINAEHFKPGLAMASESTPVIIAVGRFKEKKGFDLLIGSCARLVREGLRFRCQIIGYGDQQPILEGLISEHDLKDCVDLIPPLNHAQLVDRFQDATVCVLPCRETRDGDCDGIPNVLLEAMSCSVPVVSTTVSGIPEVIQSGVNGLLVEPDDIDALTRSIKRVLLDSGLRMSISLRGRETVREMFHWEKNVAVLSSLLSSLVATAPTETHAS